eukprot:TRINITY_DN4653_c5_g1_i1.p1 TRINITY_DN4653_c5_g1~~TRINITY_DN4653_c5_g1_i1.p1  ORF type:complete len:176 (+),score=32.88 TRINITY_DN4653_c5_g1_i1:25-528(+)
MHDETEALDSQGEIEMDAAIDCDTEEEEAGEAMTVPQRVPYFHTAAGLIVMVWVFDIFMVAALRAWGNLPPIAAAMAVLFWMRSGENNFIHNGGPTRSFWNRQAAGHALLITYIFVVLLNIVSLLNAVVRKVHNETSLVIFDGVSMAVHIIGSVMIEICDLTRPLLK